MLDDAQFDFGDYLDRVGRSRRRVAARGFDAVAWYQPFHSWTEETWGIYFDAEKLDDLACSLLNDRRQQGVHAASNSLAALLAIGLVYEHELFHARVEAALCWQELFALRPRYLRYKKRVYDALRETPRWLEEALANWWSWSWFQDAQKHGRFSHAGQNAKALERVVSTSLDLSPPGYQDWCLGNERETWRTFVTQLCSGNPNLSSPGIGLPLESALKGPPPFALPFDLLPSDVPVRFVGRGQIADRLHANPATFGVPSRRELQRALRRYRYVHSSAGKGSHEKWTGPDERVFILPDRDPVSAGDFKAFLHHVGIDKSHYVQQVRPNL